MDGCDELERNVCEDPLHSVDLQSGGLALACVIFQVSRASGALYLLELWRPRAGGEWLSALRLAIPCLLSAMSLVSFIVRWAVASLGLISCLCILRG